MGFYKQMGVLRSHSTLEPTVVGMPDWSRAINVTNDIYLTTDGWTALEDGWVYSYGVSNPSHSGTGFATGTVALFPVDKPDIQIYVLSHPGSGADPSDDNDMASIFTINAGDRLCLGTFSSSYPYAWVPYPTAASARKLDPRVSTWFVPFKRD